MRSKRLISGTGLVLGVCLFVSLNIISNAMLTNWRLDLTEDRLYTLSDGTLNILDQIDEPVVLRMYFSRDQLLGHPQLTTYGVRVRDMLREYVANSGGMLHLEIIDPEPFSPQEDIAVAEGLESIPIGTGAERAYFGLIGTNSTDDTEIIPFFSVRRESALEYELSKLVYKLANPDRRVVGVISDLPLFRDPGDRRTRDWSIVRVMRDFFDVRDLGDEPNFIGRDVDVLMIVHPKTLSDTTLYAIDQFALRGGKIMVFVDPWSDVDETPPDEQNPMAMPQRFSSFDKLFEQWGVNVPQDKIVGDLPAAMRVQHRGLRGVQEVQYLPWLRLGENNFNQDDFITSELRRVQMATSGYIERRDGTDVEIRPLLQTSTQSMILERDLVLFQRDPNVILENFRPSGRRHALAARVQGAIETAFPRGKPLDEDSRELPRDSDFVTDGELNAIVVADTDILGDRFWVQEQEQFGVDMPQPIADNGDFVINALENLAGDTDLIGLRTRGTYARPFEVVERIRRAAEVQYRAREQELQDRLQETEEKIQTLQREQGASGLIISPEQAQEIEQFRREQLRIRQELRSVQHDLQNEIQQLGSQLRFINIILVPFLVAFIAAALGLYRLHLRRRRNAD
jgi:ABC-type uncharacterized transport system involved in gliding motility auxiliary subunit